VIGLAARPDRRVTMPPSVISGSNNHEPASGCRTGGAQQTRPLPCSWYSRAASVDLRLGPAS
jgi:hypothetical protein